MIVAVPGRKVVTRPVCETVAIDGLRESQMSADEKVPAFVVSCTKLPTLTCTNEGEMNKDLVAPNVVSTTIAGPTSPI